MVLRTAPTLPHAVGTVAGIAAVLAFSSDGAGSSTKTAVMLSMPSPDDASCARLSLKSRTSAVDKRPRRPVGIALRAMSTMAWLPRCVSQTPSQPRSKNRSWGRNVWLRISGTQEIIWSSGLPRFRVRLYSKSAKALLRFKFPSIRPSAVTLPPAASMRARSALFLGLWSLDNARARPRSSQSTQRESPQLAMCKRATSKDRDPATLAPAPYSKRATMAVQPISSGLSLHNSSNTLSTQRSSTSLTLKLPINSWRMVAASDRTALRPAGLSKCLSSARKASCNATG
mmetsp:Transcript_117943/g.333596  ORF Transcript_117943/g.333596 Transcript_117943/m.333596 type:complete len:286 (-) Transcript_117943:261-1118(-)